MKLLLTVNLMIVILMANAQKYDSLADATTVNYYDLSLEELQKLKANGIPSELEAFINSLITVASQKASSTRESPSIVTLITAEEINKSGARDLVDILRLVPGFEFAFDGDNSIGIGVRGNWANEGKVLLQIDGVQVNDIFTGQIEFVNRFPLSSIKRIEIIRGPGSAIYGGFAELGVINVITKNGDDLKGLQVTGNYGQFKEGNARRTIEANGGYYLKGWDISVSALAGEGNRSDREAFVQSAFFNPFAPTTGRAISMADNSLVNPLFINTKVAFKKVSLSVIYDNHETAELGFVNNADERFVTKSANSFYSEIKYDWLLNSKLTITPSIYYTTQKPQINNLPDSVLLLEDWAERIKASVNFNYNFSRKLNLITGFNYFTDYASNDKDSITTATSFVKSISYQNYAAFLQFTAKSRVANFVLGARYENNSKFGNSFVPRIAITKKYGKMNGKVLYSSSFRSPTIENIALGIEETGGAMMTFTQGIKPEKTTVTEIEFGYQASRNTFITFNLFDTSIKDPIVYINDLGLYTNLEKTGSRGIELEARLRAKWGFVNANYSLYSVSGKEKLEVYKTKQYQLTDSLAPNGAEANSNVLLAFPAHKITLNSSINLIKGLSLAPSFVFNSERYGYDFKNNFNNVYEHYLRNEKASVIANFFINWATPVRGLELGVGAYNLFNNNYNYLGPQFARTATLPATSREFNARLFYRIKSKER